MWIPCSSGIWCQQFEENYLKVNETSDLTSFMIGFHAEYTTKMDLMKEITDLAHKYKSPVFLHNSETQNEVKECLERYGKTPTQLTEELGMYEYGGGGYHCVYFDDKDFEIFKKRQLTAVPETGKRNCTSETVCGGRYPCGDWYRRTGQQQQSGYV